MTYQVMKTSLATSVDLYSNARRPKLLLVSRKSVSKLTGDSVCVLAK